MRIGRTRYLLWTVAVFAGGVAVASVGEALRPVMLPVESLESETRASKGRASEHVQEAASLADFDTLCQIDLRRPLHDAPVAPPPPPPAPPPRPSLSIQLTGTIIEPDHNQALIAMPDGSIQMKGVGDTAGDAHILAISEGRMTVDYLGQQTVLTVVPQNQN